MLSVLVLSERGEGYVTAKKLAERCIVRFWVECPEYFQPEEREDLPKWFQMVNNPKIHLEASDFFISYLTRRGDINSMLEATGRLVLFPSKFKVLLEDPEYKIGVLKLLPTSPIEEGLPFIVDGLFIKDKWVNSYAISDFRTRFLNGDLGVLTIPTGVVTRLTNSDPIGFIFDKLTPILKSITYTGFVSLYINFNESGVEVFDIGTGISFDDYFYYWEGCMDKDIEKVFFSEKPLKVWDTYVCSLLVSRPPFPYPLITPKSETKWVEVKKDFAHHCFLNNTNGDPHGMIGYICARGVDIPEAKRRVYRTFENILRSKELQVRYDIGVSSIPVFQQLIEWGYISTLLKGR